MDTFSNTSWFEYPLRISFGTTWSFDIFIALARSCAYLVSTNANICLFISSVHPVSFLDVLFLLFIQCHSWMSCLFVSSSVILGFSVSLFPSVSFLDVFLFPLSIHCRSWMRWFPLPSNDILRCRDFPFHPISFLDVTISLSIRCHTWMLWFPFLSNAILGCPIYSFHPVSFLDVLTYLSLTSNAIFGCLRFIFKFGLIPYPTLFLDISEVFPRMFLVAIQFHYWMYLMLLTYLLKLVLLPPNAILGFFLYLSRLGFSLSPNVILGCLWCLSLPSNVILGCIWYYF